MVLIFVSALFVKDDQLSLVVLDKIMAELQRNKLLLLWVYAETYK